LAYGDIHGRVSTGQFDTTTLSQSKLETWDVANESIGGVALHPTMPFVAACSGERHFVDDDDEEDSGDVNFSSEISLYAL
jgi:hypothetical protein